MLLPDVQFVAQSDLAGNQSQDSSVAVAWCSCWRAVWRRCAGVLRCYRPGCPRLPGGVAGWQPALPAGDAGFPGWPEWKVASAGGCSWCCLVAACCLGGLCTAFAPEARGAGTGAAVEAFHQRDGVVPISAPLPSSSASIVTLGSGGSAGREGPIAMVGGGLASWFGGRLHLSRRDRRILLAAGIGGGVAAMFRAPLAGALFAAEVLYSIQSSRPMR